MQGINYILRMYTYVVKYKQMHGNDKYELLDSGCLWWGNKRWVGNVLFLKPSGR